MARPIQSGMEKRVIISISIPPSIKEYIVKNNVSPSKMFLEMFYKYVENFECVAVAEIDNSKIKRDVEIKQALEYFKKVFRKSLLPSNDYFKGIKQRDSVCKIIQEKYPELTKAILWNYAERLDFTVGNEKFSDNLKDNEDDFY